MKFKFSKKYLILLFVFLSLFSIQETNGQVQDSVKSEKKSFKNSVKLNITNPMIFGTKCIIFGYERTIGNHQSFSVNAGRFELPKLFNISLDSLRSLNKSTKSRGISLSGDYRFYLAKLNKFNAPRGVYIGPYFNFDSFNRVMSYEHTTNGETDDVSLDINFRCTSVGFQLGYQFVFWDRLSLDMVLFGPGIGHYKLQASLSTTLDSEQAEELFTKINEKLSEKIPGYEFVLKTGDFEKTGTTEISGAGFRYIVMLGFRF
jgi:hypothetical protein